MYDFVYRAKIFCYHNCCKGTIKIMQKMIVIYCNKSDCDKNVINKNEKYYDLHFVLLKHNTSNHVIIY